MVSLRTAEKFVQTDAACRKQVKQVALHHRQRQLGRNRFSLWIGSRDVDRQRTAWLRRGVIWLERDRQFPLDGKIAQSAVELRPVDHGDRQHEIRG